MATDRKILSEMQRDAGQSLEEIAKRGGVFEDAGVESHPQAEVKQVMIGAADRGLLDADALGIRGDVSLF